MRSWRGNQSLPGPRWRDGENYRGFPPQCSWRTTKQTGANWLCQSVLGFCELIGVQHRPDWIDNPFPGQLLISRAGS